ncbi:MAG: hypothetical protein ACOYT7_03130 [Patescibacteria group bacterium]
MKKVLFFLIWTVSLLVIPLTVFKVTPLSLAFIKANATLNVLQRIAGLLAFTLLFWQIIFGAFMDKWIEKLGAWVFKFHVTEGAVAYALIILHPFLFVLFNFKVGKGFDPFYVFTDFCVLCSNRQEPLYTLGRVSFWLVTLAVVAAKFRTSSWLRVHWRKFHILNYLTFILIGIHSRFVGTDSLTPPFAWFWWLATTAVLVITIYKLCRSLPLEAF